MASPPRVRATVPPASRRLLAVLGDDRLVAQVRRGSEAAFEVIYQRHYRGVLSFVRQLLGSREEAEDVVQHTFVAAYRDLVASDKPIRLKPWLYTIARNRALSVLRAARDEAEPVELSTAGLSEDVERRADLRQLLADLAELPERQRSALVLAEVGDLSHPEIAEVLECHPNKVKSLVYQARSALIDSREARLIPCAEVREEIAMLGGGALRRGRIRRHLKTCPRCTAYREEVRSQRQRLAVVLPVLPSFGAKSAPLTAAGLGTATGGHAAAGGALGGGLVTTATAVKVAVAVASIGVAGAGTFAIVEQAPRGGSTQKGTLADRPRSGAVQPSSPSTDTGAGLSSSTLRSGEPASEDAGSGNEARMAESVGDGSGEDEMAAPEGRGLRQLSEGGPSDDVGASRGDEAREPGDSELGGSAGDGAPAPGPAPDAPDAANPRPAQPGLLPSVELPGPRLPSLPFVPQLPPLQLPALPTVELTDR